MRAWIVVFLGAAAGLRASPPVIIYQPAPRVTVVSPLTPPTSQANQSVLNQINGKLEQRRFEHQVLTTNAALRAQPVFVRPR